MTRRARSSDLGAISRLTRAVEAFNASTSSLEGAYQALQSRVADMTAELEAKNRLLEDSLARQRQLEAEAIRHGRLAAMGEMAATLAHEIRNPLGSMELFSSLLLEDLSEHPAAQRLVGQIAEGIKDLNHLVSNILGFTRVATPRVQRIDVAAAADDAIRYAGTLLAENRIGIVRDYGAEPVLAAADGAVVRHVFLNLVRNAAQAMEDGGTLTVRVRHGARAAVAFADTGPGIPEETREQVFEPFYTTRERGTGLGLAVVKTLVEAVGGEVTHVPGSEGGACFIVTLPLAAGEGGRAASGRDAYPVASASADHPERP